MSVQMTAKWGQNCTVRKEFLPSICVQKLCAKIVCKRCKKKHIHMISILGMWEEWARVVKGSFYREYRFHPRRAETQEEKERRNLYEVIIRRNRKRNRSIILRMRIRKIRRKR